MNKKLKSTIKIAVVLLFSVVTLVLAVIAFAIHFVFTPEHFPTFRPEVDRWLIGLESVA